MRSEYYLGPGGDQAVIEGREGEVGDNVGVTLNLPHCAPVLSSGSILKIKRFVSTLKISPVSNLVEAPPDLTLVFPS